MIRISMSSVVAAWNRPWPLRQANRLTVITVEWTCNRIVVAVEQSSNLPMLGVP